MAVAAVAVTVQPRPAAGTAGTEQAPLLARAGVGDVQAWRDSLAVVPVRADAFARASRLAPALVRGLQIPVGSARAAAEAEAVFFLAAAVYRLPAAELVTRSEGMSAAAPDDVAARRLRCWSAGLLPDRELTAALREERVNLECDVRAAGVLKTWEQLLREVIPAASSPGGLASQPLVAAPSNKTQPS